MRTISSFLVDRMGVEPTHRSGISRLPSPFGHLSMNGSFEGSLPLSGKPYEEQISPTTLSWSNRLPTGSPRATRFQWSAWQEGKESNPHLRIWRPPCYRYTTDPYRQSFLAVSYSYHPAFGAVTRSAITTSRLEGLTSGPRITHTAYPSRRPRRIGGICRI